ncbi:unnamed protein product, partial [Larinioides sclopetarius]
MLGLYSTAVFLTAELDEASVSMELAEWCISEFTYRNWTTGGHAEISTTSVLSISRSHENLRYV